MSSPGGNDDNQAGPVPEQPIKEDSITNFEKNAGDSSRAVMWMILAAAAIALIGIMFFTDG